MLRHRPDVRLHEKQCLIELRVQAGRGENAGANDGAVRPEHATNTAAILETVGRQPRRRRCTHTTHTHKHTLVVRSKQNKRRRRRGRIARIRTLKKSNAASDDSAKKR
ncbi:hypothetical protein WA026_004194 [Henosepilachna vigintioctopunctata]|uniref:Uncharacterized protein n=1 Tax=Henosepilachna vigintioctopunctata TaxID=420089 RepID=A0AAW1UDX2_9CUCU